MAITNPTAEDLTIHGDHLFDFVAHRANYKNVTQTELIRIPFDSGVTPEDKAFIHFTNPPLAGYSLILGPGASFTTLAGLTAQDGVTYVGQKDYDLYLTTGFVRDDEGRFHRYRADPARHRQMVWRSGTRYSERPVNITPATLTPVDWRELPASVRSEYMHTLADYVTSRGAHLRHRETLNELFAPPRDDRIMYRDRVVTPYGYKTLRRGLKQFGELVADAENRDASDAADLLGGFADLVPDSCLSRMIDIWNERAYSVDEIALGSCGHVTAQEDLRSTLRDGDVCSDCIEDHYVWASDADDYIHEDQAYWYDGGAYAYEQEDDDDDDDDYLSGSVRDYSSNVLDFYGKDTRIDPSPYGDFLLGVELEVVPQMRASSDAASDTAEFMEGYAILKRDGSLPDRGFEIVTAPRGLAEHIEQFTDWKPHPELRAWDAESCGMHVHISSQAFTQATLGKFFEFVNSKANDAFIEAIAGRHPSTSGQCQEYCAREGMEFTGNPKKNLEGKSTNRYRMVNTQNLSYDECRRLGLCTSHAVGRSINTIELRIFRATLKKERLLAQIEFAHAAVMFCRWASFRALTGREFLEWLQGMAGQYPHLAKWFGVRANKKEIDESPKVRETAEV